MPKSKPPRTNIGRRHDMGLMAGGQEVHYSNCWCKEKVYTEAEVLTYIKELVGEEIKDPWSDTPKGFPDTITDRDEHAVGWNARGQEILKQAEENLG